MHLNTESASCKTLTWLNTHHNRPAFIIMNCKIRRRAREKKKQYAKKDKEYRERTITIRKFAEFQQCKLIQYSLPYLFLNWCKLITKRSRSIFSIQTKVSTRGDIQDKRNIIKSLTYILYCHWHCRARHFRKYALSIRFISACKSSSFLFFLGEMFNIELIISLEK